MKDRNFLFGAVILSVCVYFAMAGIRDRYQSVSIEGPAVDLATLIKPHSPTLGISTAPVTIVEFLDPQCEACRGINGTVKRVLNEYSGQVKLVIRYLNYHASSLHASLALEEAREYDKFNEALDILFEKQPEWGSHSKSRPELITAYLVGVGIPASALALERLVAKHSYKVELDRVDAQNIGVTQAPTFFVNGVRLDHAGYPSFKSAIEQILKKKK